MKTNFPPRSRVAFLTAFAGLAMMATSAFGASPGMVSNAMNANGTLQIPSSCTSSRPSTGRYIIKCPKSLFHGHFAFASITPIGPAVLQGISQTVQGTQAIADIKLSTNAIFNILLVERGDYSGTPPPR